MYIEFYCQVNTTETDTRARFEFRFLFNGVVANDVPVIPVSGSNPRATLHERYLAGRLDQLVRTAELYSREPLKFFAEMLPVLTI